MFSVQRCARSLLVSALCAVATGCGSSTTNCWQVTLLNDGRSEWGSEHGDVILVPRGLSVTREIRLTNRTGTILQNLSARTGCPTCSSARIKAEDLPNGESSVLAVTVALAGPSCEGDRKVRVFMSADRVGAAEPRFLDRCASRGLLAGGGIPQVVYGRALSPSTRLSAHGRCTLRTPRAAQPPAACRPGTTPPLRASPPREDFPPQDHLTGFSRRSACSRRCSHENLH